MSRKDILDPDLLSRFAWRTAATLPADDADPPQREVEAPPPEPPRAKTAANQATPDACHDLAGRTARAWGMKPRARQAMATRHVLGQLAPVRVGFLGLAEHPREAVRLWRLGVRHWRVLGPGARRVLWAMPIVVGEPEAVDLLVEAVQTGDEALTSVLDGTDLPEAVGRAFPALGTRLAHVLEHGETWAARELAARWALRADRRAAVEALRRALRRPLLRLRTCALKELLQLSPTALAPEDVQWLLEDAVKHPLPGEGRRPAHGPFQGYEAALIEAANACPPPEGWRPLTVLADGGGALMGWWREALGMAWALAALAAGWPERAVVRIDRMLAESMLHQHADAIEAAGCLPDALARPRLIEGAALPNHEAAERAREIWLERFGDACPIDPLTGVPVELLDGPPSDALLGRLTVLRGASAEARKAVVDAALAEAPSREALAFLLYSLRDFGDAHGASVMRQTEETWAGTLLARFGAPAFDGILALAAREAPAGVRGGWLGALVELARKGALDGAQRDRLRDLAAGAIGDPASSVSSTVFYALEVVGTPPSMIERLWAMALRPASPDPEPGEESRRLDEARGALGALGGAKGSPEIDARFAEEAEAAMARGAWETVGDLVSAGARRKRTGLLVVAAGAIEAAESDPGARVIAEPCARALQYAGFRDERWIAETLEHPASPLFAVAAKLVHCSAGPAVLEALERALDDRSRDGRSAAEAAEALVGTEALAPDDSRLDGVLERAPEDARRSLASRMLNEGASLASVRRHYAALLLSKDEEIAAQAYQDVEMCDHSEGRWELLESALALGPTTRARDSIAWYLGEPKELEMYWRELGYEDDELM